MTNRNIIFEVRKSHVEAEGYLAYLVVGDERIFIDKPLPDVHTVEDLRIRLAKQFAMCGANMVVDVE